MTSAKDQHKTAARELRIFQVMPRQMHFGPKAATSIDLCVHDLMQASSLTPAAHIFCEAVPAPFPGYRIMHLPPARRAATFHRANFIAYHARRLNPDVIVVQQHLPTAAAIAWRLPHSRIILHTHNFQKTYPAPGFRERMRKSARTLRYNRLAGICHVSEACHAAFTCNWPEVTAPACILKNGLDFSQWSPGVKRKNEIVFAGRCAPEKGVMELARAATEVLRDYPGWRAKFFLSAKDAAPELFAAVKTQLVSFGDRAEIFEQRPFPEVKLAFESAAIAVVPSICQESFGRSALEAHAGGAALISSGRGGLAEVSGPTATRLDDVTAPDIAQALRKLILDRGLRERLAREGEAWVKQRFDIKLQAEIFDAFCHTVATRKFSGKNGMEARSIDLLRETA